MQCIFNMGVQIMPYCPKCDMEFVEGIKVCSDCGGPLVESKEVAEAMKKKEQEEQPARHRGEKPRPCRHGAGDGSVFR